MAGPIRQEMLMEPVLMRMDALAPPPPLLEERVRALGAAATSLPPGAPLEAEGERRARPHFVLAGWAIRQRQLPDGRRHVVEVLLPGEGLGLEVIDGPAVCTTLALTKLTVVDASRLLAPDSVAATPGLRAWLDRRAVEQERRRLDHLLRLGRYSGVERVLDFFEDLQARLETVGLVDDDGFHLPLTQELLADALGLSTVHLNRIVQQLRRQGALVSARRRFRVNHGVRRAAA